MVGLNTAFLQLTGDDYEGKLAVSIEQLVSVCGEHFTDWFDLHSCSFLMIHHPPTWLSPSSRSTLSGDIALPGRFVAELCGHMHDPLTRIQSFGGAPNQRLWQGASLFGLEVFADTYERRHGYSAGKLEISRDKGSLRLWPRLAQKHQAGHWHFVRDPSATLESDDGSAAQEFSANLVASLVHGTKDVFRVLLLSTNADLQPTREAVAEHLRKSLGIEVEENASGDLGRFHLVILIQAWWWDSGSIATLWRDIDPDRRVAFVSDEAADWPPHRLLEIAAHSDIAAFRAAQLKSHKFGKPEQLTEIVGAVVTERLQAHAGTQTAGLKSWERTYLEFRIPAWRSGRTALSQPHLFDAADAKELYQPDLYTSLDGVTNKWQRGKNGEPAQSEGTGKKAGIAILERRVRLAKWVTVPQLPRIALIGAPGGGKTIFLTRIAAALGSACLGRPVEIEPDLKVEKLRADNRLPVPVVIEATRIAHRDASRVVALLEVIADELASAGTNRLDLREIESGLEEGRYFLLIDALDEIADSAKRSQTLQLLKGTSSVFPRTRFILTTRTARYTGRLRFGPELESIEVAPLDTEQVQQLCANWSRNRQRDEEYNRALLGAVSGLADKVGLARQDQALTENPLMLTAICMVFERYRSLPDDRGRLCELLIEDLCRSRVSEDPQRRWKLDEGAKKDLLQRLALGMQEHGAQTWPFERAVDIALNLVPTNDLTRRERAKRYVDWAADHTGILRFQEASEDAEQIRFWHRLFREYLSASRLAQEDSTADQKITKLWNEGRLLDPFWEDVIRLLPRTLGTIEKARSLRERLEQLAAEYPKERGRLLGLAAAGIIENRDLYPDVDFRKMAKSMATVYEAESEKWSVTDRLLFLDGVGRLDPSFGDPRTELESWVEIRPNNAFAVYHTQVLPEEVKLAFGRVPVTVQDFNQFVKSSEFLNPMYWREMPDEAQAQRDSSLRYRVQQQMYHPNRPIVQIGIYEAMAYCRWRTAGRPDARTVRLPFISEWQKLEHAVLERNVLKMTEQPAVDKIPFNCLEAGVNQPSPVGAFPLQVCGAYDVVGNVWEWLLPSTKRDIHRRRYAEIESDLGFAVGGGAFDLKGGSFSVSLPPPELAFYGFHSIGFRCVLTSQGFDFGKWIQNIRKELASSTGPGLSKP